MSLHALKKRTQKAGGWLLAIAIVVVGWLAFGYWSKRSASDNASASMAGAAVANPTVIEIPRQVAELNHMAIAAAKLPTRERELLLRGELAIDFNRLVHVHALFPGRIVELANADDSNTPSAHDSKLKRPVGFMDHVVKDQSLAVLHSKDFGATKSELVDALANLALDQEAYERIKALDTRGAASETSVREAERQVATGRIAVKKAELTLRSWGVPEEVIENVKREVESIRNQQDIGKREDAEWARVDIKSPIDGTIVEKNITIGDIVDTTSDLFKIADLSVLTLWLHAYEEDLPYLERLPSPIPVRIRIPANPEIGELPAAIESIGDLINPLEHMAVLVGHVDNASGDLRAGQFVQARVSLAPEEGVVEIPTRALVQDGSESVVFVQENPDEYRFRPRKVSVARKYYDIVYIRSELTDEQRAAGEQELHVGDRVAASETVQLQAAFRQQQLTASEAKQQSGVPKR
ncbi:MAG TPA: efflux RND transporter periplasmic adaptor subunit [Pirellulales bacterium]|nr:efflux RND transporter periplasmic adaptor subunit [Pirellulales bacterium]